MAVPGDDKPRGTPPGNEGGTTPYDPSDSSETAVDLNPTDAALRALRQRYDVMAEVGRGGMGIVYRARDRETGDVVALKVLKPEIATRPELIERFKAELLLARRITHKNVCRTHELLRFGDTVVIAMEFVEGQSLRNLLDRVDGLSPHHGRKLLAQILAGLGEAHAQGVVHRDLKPENIIIGTQGNVKVMDFGIARSLETTTSTAGSIVGTPAYMSPEQAEAKPADARSDIYSLGLIMYEMFTGAPAFKADTPVALALKQIRDVPPPPRQIEPELPASLDRAIQKCLEKKPERRFRSVEELEAALAGAKPVEPVPAQAELPARLATGQRSDLVLLLFGVLALIIFVRSAKVILPETNVPVTLSGDERLRSAINEMASWGLRPPDEPSWVSVGTWQGRQAYDFLAQTRGAAEARAWLERGGRFAGYEFVWEKGQHFVGRVSISLGGSLDYINLPVADLVSPGPGPSLEKARAMAQQRIQQAFAVDVAGLEKIEEGTQSVEGRNGYKFSWVQREPTGIKHTYSASIFDRPTSVGHGLSIPADFQELGPYYDMRIIVIPMGALILVLFISRRLYLQIERKAVRLFGIVALFCSVWGNLGLAGTWRASTMFAIMKDAAIIVVAFLLLSPVAIHYATRRWPYIASTCQGLLRAAPFSSATALGFVRGTICGQIIVGIYAGLLWLATYKGLTWPRLQEWDTELNSLFVSMTALSKATQQAFGTAFLICFVVSIARRWISRPALLALAAGTFWLAAMSTSTSGDLPRDPVQWALTFLVAAGFAGVFLGFDLLTLLVAAFAFQLWLDGYALLKMLEPVSGWYSWLPFWLWYAFIAWAVFVTYRPLWTRVGKRVAEAFE